jgi:ABC-2 type transport system permease protein
MSYAMVRRLIYKDWYFNRGAIAAYVAVGLAALATIGLGGTGAFYAGSVLLITVVISIGIQLTMVTVVHERSYQTLPFVMTLPVSIREYTLAKLAANLSIFAAAWLLLLVTAVALIAGRGALPDGLIPFAVVILVQLFTGYVLTLVTAILSESLGWTIAAIIVNNLLVQGVMFWVSNVPAIARDIPTSAIAWHQPIPALLAGDALFVVLAVVATFYLQARKKDFL